MSEITLIPVMSPGFFKLPGCTILMLFLVFYFVQHRLRHPGMAVLSSQASRWYLFMQNVYFQ